MPFIPVREGFVAQLATGQKPAQFTVGPRIVVGPQGDLLCSAMVQTALGRNDFVPVLYRSADLGETWTDQGPVWPELQSSWSIFASISGDRSGNLYLFGSRSPIDVPGESFWSDETQGIKQNELIWSKSTDGGSSWTEPQVVPMPIPGSAEAPGALCVTRHGRWIAPYSPYSTFDSQLQVDRGQVVAVYSDDEGRLWKHASMLRFAEPESGGAEAWLVELGDGRLLGTGWHLDLSGTAGRVYPNEFAISSDGGQTWGPTCSTRIFGQSTALSRLPDGRGLFIYNQRKHGEIGVWLAVVNPIETSFGIESNQIIWKAQTRTQSGSSGEHAEWYDFSFGEPSITPLPDGTLMAVLWCIQPAATGVAYVKLRWKP